MPKNEPKKSGDNGKPIVPRDPVTGQLLPGAQLHKYPVRPEVQALRELKSDILYKISPTVIPVWLELLANDSPKIRLGAVKLAVENILPKQIIHSIVGKMLHEIEGGEGDKIHGLLTALPAFGDFLKWKQAQEGKIVDVEPVSKDDK